MSRKIPEQQYEKTISYRFRQWLDGTKDPFLGTVEMKPQKEFHEDDTALEKRKEEKKEIFARVFDTEHNAELRMFRKLYRLFSVLFCIGLVFVLLTGVSHLPPFGAADNPVNNEVPRRYIENGLQETGAVNIVTGMILDYRAFDTLGESHVLFVATCTVLILLRIDKKKGRNSIEEREANDRIYEPKNDIILQTVAKLLVPPIMIFGIYVILCGHLGPGGGFSGGAVIGAGLILYLNAFGFAKTERFFTAKTYKWMSFGALACYALAKSYSFYTGANDIHSIIPLGTPGAILSSGLILLLNICVGIVVAGTMYTFMSCSEREATDMNVMNLIQNNYEEAIAMILFGIGFSNLLLQQNLIKKIIGLNIMDTAMYLFLALKGYISGQKAPIVVNGVQKVTAYINPIPAGLVLTGIVVSVSVTALMLSLTIRLYRRYHTLNLDEITTQLEKEGL